MLHVPVVVVRDVETVRSQRYRSNKDVYGDLASVRALMIYGQTSPVNVLRSNWEVETLKETGRVNMANIHREMLQKATAGILNTTAKLAVYITAARESKVSYANGQIHRDLK